MLPSDLKARLGRVKATSVKVKLREKEVIAGLDGSGLWPRVTLSLDGKEEQVSLTEYAETKKKEDEKGKLDKLEVAILRICGVESRAMRSVKSNASLKWALQDAAKNVRLRISSALSKARTTQKLGSRIEDAQRRKRRKIAMGRLEETFRDLFRKTVRLKDLSGAEVGRIWERAKLEVVVDEVHDF